MEQKYTVDARGEQCPIPVVKTKKVLDGIQGDAEITVLVDNETAVQNLTRMGKHAGAEVLSEKKIRPGIPGHHPCERPEAVRNPGGNRRVHPRCQGRFRDCS